MPLPFFKKDRRVGLIVEQRHPDGNLERKPDEEGDPALEACAEDLLRAMNTKDIKAIADALRAAFDVMESEPHEEAEHSEGEESPEELP
jgi:hypothetical protein